MALSAYTDGGIWEVHDENAIDGDVSYPVETPCDGKLMSMRPYVPSPPSQSSSQTRPAKRWSVEDDLLLEVRKKLRKDGSERSTHHSARANALVSNGVVAVSVSDQCEKFGQYIASSLCGMSPRQRAEAQLKIQQVLYYMSVGQSAEDMPPIPA